MKLQQLRCIHEVVKNGFSISKAAEALHTSQPGVSKQIQLLEEEVGLHIFLRHGKRLIGLSEPGQHVYQHINEVIREIKSIKQVSEEFSQSSLGVLTIATTHTQARYKLPNVVQAFMSKYPDVKLNIHQGNPTQVTDQVVKGEADIGIATESISHNDKLFCLPCYTWNRCLVMPAKHPLAKEKTVTLAKLATYPIITYDYAFTGSTIVSKVFHDAGLTPNIVLTAIDADVIKTYVNLGLGVGLIAQMAYDPKRDQGLVSIDVSHLFPTSTTYLGIRRDVFLRGFMYDFIEMFIPEYPKQIVKKLMLDQENI
ncbi:MAG: CysB family HTH-type transcriptional regulator [Candidatus Methylopumilus sp.]|jgi:LysR family cys regulon transcriptional activator|nr:CysB family HTH-type transcriptional regulator [Candidatus Methylopumilus sp.]